MPGEISDPEASVRAVLWDRPTAPRRGPKPTLTLEAVGRAAIELADAGGLAAVTMQRVAEDLGVTKMALYRYVPGKDDLVALMTDAALGPPPALGKRADGDWRVVVAEWSTGLFGRFVAHPWTQETTIGARVPGPNELAWLERAVAALSAAGLRGAATLDVAVTVTGHVRTIARQAAAGGSEHAAAERLAACVHGREDRFPAVNAALEDTARYGGGENALDFGLARILDGVQAFLDAERPRPAPNEADGE